jgi:hypothetical protein
MVDNHFKHLGLLAADAQAVGSNLLGVWVLNGGGHLSQMTRCGEIARCTTWEWALAAACQCSNM